MTLKSPEDAMPWVGLYISVASLICTLAMSADVFQGFRRRQRKLWFPCKFFTINSASITLIAIAMKLPVDLTTNLSTNNDFYTKYVSVIFLVTILANFLPSFGLMDDNELLTNVIALGILIITITVNVWIQSITMVLPLGSIKIVLIFCLIWPFSIALTVPTARRIIEHRYKEFHKKASNRQDRKISFKELEHCVKKYWMIAETSNPQFVIACSSVSSAFGVICSFFAFFSFCFLVFRYANKSHIWSGKSDYKWSIEVIYIVQSIGAIIASIAPVYRCFTATTYFNLSLRWSVNHLNVFRVEKHWTERLYHWKQIHVRSRIPGRHCKKVFHNVKNMILNFCIALHIGVLVTCKTICLIPRSFLILIASCRYFCKSLLKAFSKEPSASNSNMRSEMDIYYSYVLQIEEEAELSQRILRNALNSINQHLQESEKKEPSNLLKLLGKSIGFKGILEFDNDQVPPLHSEETQNCWSLVVVTFTAIAVALPNCSNNNVKRLLVSMREGLQFVRQVEDILNANGELVKARKAGRRLWTEVEVYRRWLQIDLQKKARKGKTSKEILQWLGDEAVKIVIQCKICKKESLDYSLHKFLVASSMHRISQTILLRCNEQEIWPKDEDLFEWMSTIIADILCACFTNLPRVIAMKCHHKAIEKRKESIWSAAQLLGKSKRILNILEACKLPKLDFYSMAYIDNWLSLSKNQISNDSASLASIQVSPCLSSSESFLVTIV